MYAYRNITNLNIFHQSYRFPLISWRWIWILVLAWGIDTQQCYSQSQDLRHRFLHEAPQKWKEHKQRCSELCLQLELKSWLRVPDSVKFDTSTIPNDYFYTLRDKSGTRLLSILGSRDSIYTCWAVNDKYAFELNRKGPSNPWLLVRINGNPKDSFIHSYASMALHNHNDYWSTSPFVLYKISLEQLVKQPGFEVVHAEQIDKGQQQLVRVEFRSPKKVAVLGSSSIDYCYENGWIIFDPERYWIPLEYKASVTWLGAQEIKTEEHGAMEYTKISHELPVLKQMDGRIKGKSTKGIPVELDFVFRTEYLIREYVPSVEEFTLSAFGLPEPVGVEWERPVRWYLWLMLAGVVCLVAGGVFYWLSRRRAGGTN
ncbi:MAG: hypothetical protein WHU94_09120 [Thermogemmata sp.]